MQVYAEFAFLLTFVCFCWYMQSLQACNGVISDLGNFPPLILCFLHSTKSTIGSYNSHSIKLMPELESLMFIYPTSCLCAP